jgi:hypothetical protein
MKKVGLNIKDEEKAIIGSKYLSLQSYYDGSQPVIQLDYFRPTDPD